MEYTGYYYNAQIRHVILCVLRMFSNFCISEGLDSKNRPILRKIPVTFMSTDKSVVYMLNNASDTVLETVPRMIVTISNVKLNSDKSSGAPYYEYQTSITEKRFDTEANNYTHDVGNSYNITRLNPVPLGLEFKLYILTSMQDHKLQLFEQIRTLFTPTLELQFSENPLDWNRITAITLTNLSWSSKNTNLDSSTLDSMDMTFEVNTNLDLPALVQRESLIHQINESILTNSSIDDLIVCDYQDATRVYHSPTNNRIEVYYNEEESREEIRLIPSEKCKNWYELFETYDVHYEGNENVAYSTVCVHCLTDANIDVRKDIIGSIYVIPETPDIAIFNIFDNTINDGLDLIAVSGILDPHEYYPTEETYGQDYLILDDIGTESGAWGKLFDAEGNEIDKINKNCVVECFDGSNGLVTQIIVDPENNPETKLFLRDYSAPQFLYTYNRKYKTWVDFINKRYPVGFWRISDKPIYNK